MCGRLKRPGFFHLTLNMLSKLLLVAQLVVTALAAPETTRAATDVESYVQTLLDSGLLGDELLAAYDEHYDGLPQPEKMEEKAAYPDDVYQYLLQHRASIHGVNK